MVAGAALQLATYGLAYGGGADITSDAVAQYRAARVAGEPAGMVLFLRWPGFIAAPVIEESIFRGFLWRGWEDSRLGARGTWLLSSLVFAAYHIPKVLGMSPFGAGIILCEDLLLGLLLGWLRWRSRSIFPAMAAHFAYNVVPPVFDFIVGAVLAA